MIVCKYDLSGLVYFGNKTPVTIPTNQHPVILRVIYDNNSYGTILSREVNLFKNGKQSCARIVAMNSF